MSRENVEIVRRALAAVEGGRVSEALSDFLDPACAWITDPRAPGGGRFEGRDEILAYLAGVSEQARAVHFDVDEVIDSPAGTLAITSFTARGSLSDAPMQTPWCFLVSFRDGRAVRVRNFLDVASARQAAGLSA